MSEKEKAKELFDKYFVICQEFTEEIQCSIQAKESALIAVDEILDMCSVFTKDYWQEVKHEIEKL